MQGGAGTRGPLSFSATHLPCGEGVVLNENDEGTIDMICQTCKGCGHRKTPNAWGHYGDCNGDAGEAKKPIVRLCPDCGGTGAAHQEGQAKYGATEAMLALLNFLVGNRKAISARQLELKAWCLLDAFGLTELTQTEIAEACGCTRAHISKQALTLRDKAGCAPSHHKSEQARKVYGLRQMIVSQTRKQTQLSETEKRTADLWRINYD